MPLLAKAVSCVRSWQGWELGSSTEDAPGRRESYGHAPFTAITFLTTQDICIDAAKQSMPDLNLPTPQKGVLVRDTVC